jgi:site-specific DNA-cytosine methylase
MSGVYYNEFNPRMAEWLRGLIADKLIAPGEVDSRSITDVHPDDLKGFTQCHFFAGLGGWSYALRLAGWDDERPVWTGSCPCQPFSAAGKRKGFDDERHLWPAWYRLIAERRPPKIFGEQVARLPAWLALVRGDLEAVGYAVGAMPIEAASAGAYHFRDRFWIVAKSLVNAESERRGEGRAESELRSGRNASPGPSVSIEPMADAKYTRPPRAGGKPQHESNVGQSRNDSAKKGRRGKASGPVADAFGSGRAGPGLSAERRESLPELAGRSGRKQNRAGRKLADAIGEGPHARALPGIHRSEESRGARNGESKRYSGTLDMADADRAGLEKRERAEIERGDLREQGPAAQYDSARRDGPLGYSDAGNGVEWAIGSDGKARPVEPGIRLLAHAVSGCLAIQRPGKETTDPETYCYSRIAAIEGFGNAIDPVMAATFIRAADEAMAEK